MTECKCLFPYLFSHKNWFIAYRPILSMLRIFLDTNFIILNLMVKAYFTFDTSVEIQNVEDFVNCRISCF